MLADPTIKVVVVEHKDRATRFGFRSIETLLEQQGRHIEVVNVAENYIAYKALLVGSKAVQVDAYHTSQACPRCGYTSPDNRPEKGLLFICQACHLTLHADLIGARNIALRTPRCVER